MGDKTNKPLKLVNWRNLVINKKYWVFPGSRMFRTRIISVFVVGRSCRPLGEEMEAWRKLPWPKQLLGEEAARIDRSMAKGRSIDPSGFLAIFPRVNYMG